MRGGGATGALIGFTVDAISSTGAAVAGPSPTAFTVESTVEDPPADVIAKILYLERCVGGCTYTEFGLSDSRQNWTYLGTGQPGTTYQVAEFGHDDATWDAIVACVTEVYAPYGITVTDVDPGDAPHHEAVIAGTADNIGLDPFAVGGVGPLYADCSIHDNTVSFTFANAYPADAEALCAVAAQETGHGFGVEHSFNCADPMTYLPACGLQFFRSGDHECGEYLPRPCKCYAAQQDVHERLLAALGANPVPLPPPVVTLLAPADGATVGAGFTIDATVVDRRGVSDLEIWLNGYRWDTVPAAPLQDELFVTPVNVPDGIIDLELRGYNDLRTAVGTARATITQGAPCATEATCREGQRCEAGRCLWDPPTGVLGDACDYPQACLSEICEAGTCSQPCHALARCPFGYECVTAGTNDGYCLPEPNEPGGCCSVGDDGPGAGALFAQLGLAGLVLGGALRRRRPSTARGASRRARSG